MNHIIAYLEELESHGKAQNTLITYGFHLRAFYNWKIRKNLNLAYIKQSDMIKFREHLINADKNHRTINAILSCVRGLYDYLILHEIATKNPVPKQLHLQVTRKIIEPLTHEEFNEFISYFDRVQENIRCAFLCMATTGARVGEVAALKKSDFITRKRRYCIDIKNAKWGSDRIVPILHKGYARIIKRYIDQLELYDQPAFRVSRRTLQTYAQKFSNDTGIELHCHKLRHTVATRLLEQGVSSQKIQHLLGHKSQYVTQHYTSQANVDLFDINIS